MKTINLALSSIEELEKGSEIIQSSFGTVEFKRHGSAPYLLPFHGTPGGFDWILNLVAPFVNAGFGYISPSRPGYLRTPLNSGQTFKEQADTFAALLDELKVEKVVAYGVSGGGPPAILFAANYPDRVHSLLLNCAVTRSHKWNIPAWIDKLQLFPPFLRFQNCMFEKFPKVMIKALLLLESTYNAAERDQVANMITNSPEILKLMRQLIYVGIPFGPRLTGFRNDLSLLASMGRLPFEEVKCPTLIAHGTADGDVPFSHAEAASTYIPNSQLYKMEGAWHFLWLSENADEMMQDQVEFAMAHL
jgi:pimeloyl-ACP methyl ester carboxylesterase